MTDDLTSNEVFRAPKRSERLRQRAAWTSTFIAGLELAMQGGALLEQEDQFTAMYVSPAPTEPKP